MIGPRMTAQAAGRLLVAAAFLTTVAACGDAGDDVPGGYQDNVAKAANGEDVEFDIVDENDNNLNDKQRAELKAWEDQQNEEINRRIKEMREE